MAESTEMVNIDQEWSEGLLDDSSKYAAEIVEKLSDLGDSPKLVCDEGITVKLVSY